MINYKSAGVDIDAGNEVVKRIKKGVQETYNKNVLSELGGFAGLYDLKPLFNEYIHPVLVQSIDGLGTFPVVPDVCIRGGTTTYQRSNAPIF